MPSSIYDVLRQIMDWLLENAGFNAMTVRSAPRPVVAGSHMIFIL